MVDYVMKISMTIDTEAKKNTIRNTLQTSISAAFTAGTIKEWNMSITPVIVPSEDVEQYQNP